MKPPKPVYSYLAAAVLAVVTVFTFYVFRDFGPQSVLRKFHIDVVRQDWADIPLIATEGVDSPATKQMIAFVQDLARRNASFEIVRMQRQGNHMLTGVEYRLPNGLGVGVVWYIRQTERDWRVDTGATARQLFRGPELMR